MTKLRTDISIKDYYSSITNPLLTKALEFGRSITYIDDIEVNCILQARMALIKDSEVFFGDFPIMSDKGTFLINGSERVIVSQLVRSSGIT